MDFGLPARTGTDAGLPSVSFTSATRQPRAVAAPPGGCRYSFTLPTYLITGASGFTSGPK
jgi:hypothetical protein